MRIIRFLFVFLVGALGYGLVEMAWRGRTHPTMLFAGGLCFALIGATAKRMRGYSIIATAGVCALIITAVELAFGMEFNLVLGMGVWDYSRVPLNLMGQICPWYSLLWWGLSVTVIPFAEFINRKIEELEFDGISV